MSVRNRPTRDGRSRWYTRVYDPGRGRFVERVSGRTEKAARRVERRRLDQVDEYGTITELVDGTGGQVRKNPTLDEWTRVYMELYTQDLASREHIARQVKALVEFFGPSKLSAITPLQVAAFKKWCIEDGHQVRAGRGVSPRTVNIRLGILRAMWNRAREAKLVSGDNPVRRRDLLPTKRRVVPRPSECQFQELLDACRPTRATRARPELADVVLFLRFTACRLGEALNLRVLDVDFRSRELTFRHTKNGDDRTLPLLEHISGILKRQDTSTGYFFGGEAQRNRLRLAWQRARGRAGFDDLHLHDFRHIASTHMTAQHVDYVSNEYVLGHRVRGVFGIYTHPTREGVANALAALRSPFPETPDSAT